MYYEVLNINDPASLINVDSISKTLARIVTSQFNDQATILINGNRGSGKSYLGLELGYKTAIEISNITGKPAGNYFPMNLDNVAIIRLDRVIDVMGNLQQYGIYFLDDIGVGYSNREWRSDKNQRMNKILQTFRTDNVITILSVPDKGMIDKVPREMIDKYIETNKENNMYSLGLNLVKVFNIERLLRDDKTLEILPLIENMGELNKYAKYVCKRPPQKITETYDVMRKQIAKYLRKEESEALKNGEIEKVKAPKRISQKQIIYGLRMDWNNNLDGCNDKYDGIGDFFEDNGIDRDYGYKHKTSSSSKLHKGK